MSRARVAAVLSLFSPPASLPDRVRALRDQVDAVVAVDDSAEPAASAAVHEALRDAGAEVLVTGENRGIAHALNRGVTRALAIDPACWIMTLDQDSTVPAGYVDAALATFADATAAGLAVGGVCPWFLGDAPTPDEGTDRGFSLAFDPIQSALLMPAATIERCGPFAEEYFIDSVDSEYTLRMRRHGLVVVRAPDTRLTHAMGTPRPLRFLGRRLTRNGRPAHVPYQRPFRVYYITRNALALNAEYGREFRGWLARRNRAELLHGAVRLLWGPGRLKIARAMWAGAIDQRRGRSGRIPDRLARALV